MARKLDGTQEPGTPRTRARRQPAQTTNAAPRAPERRRKPRSPRPHLNMRGTLADAAPMPREPLEPLLSPKDVARYLGCATKTVRRLVLDGHLRQLRVAGKATPRFRREHVEALVTVDPISRKPRGGSGTPGGSTPPAP